MDWDKGYQSEFYMTKVDPKTWRDIGRVEITGGDIKLQSDGLMESATIDVVNYDISFVEQWIRVYMVADQSGDTDRKALFTGIATTPSIGWQGSMHEDALECYSVLKPLDDIDLLVGWYAAKGRKAGDVIKELLAATPAPIEISSGSPKLDDYIIAEGEETKLTMLEKILTSIGWQLRIKGDGTICAAPPNEDPVATFDPNAFDVIQSEINVERDVFSCPNVFMAAQDEEIAIAKDEASGSAVSTIIRGREVWMRESGVSLAETETLSQYAARRLKEEQKTQLKASYSRRYVPVVRPNDVIRLNYPEQGLTGNFTVSTQSIAIEYCATTQEEVLA